MLARYLRVILLLQFLTGALLGSGAAWALLPHRTGGTLVVALTLMVCAGVVWILFWQAGVMALSMLLSHPGGSMGPWLHALWREIKATLLVFDLRQPWVTTRPAVLLPLGQPQPGAPALPVLLVHGFVCNHRVWDRVADALRQAGHTVLAIDLEPLFTPIDDYAALIEQAVSTLRRQTGTAQVVLVGHSMGGLAIRAWLRAFGSAHAARIITLGTPHQGTQAPQWLRTPNGAQMQWHSTWLSELAQAETPAQRQLMQLAITQHDNIVYPQRAQVLAGATVTEFSGIGHLAMCLDAQVIRWLVQQVDAAGANHS